MVLRITDMIPRWICLIFYRVLPITSVGNDKATNENWNFDLRVQRVKVKFIFNICIFGNYWMRLSVIFKTMQTDDVLSAKTVGQKLMSSERFPLLPPDYGTSPSLKFELVLMLIFLNLSWNRFFLKRYMTFSFIIFVFVSFPF